MPQTELTIQLRVTFSGDDAEEKIKMITENGKMVARQWYTTALLLSDKRKPQVIYKGSDFFVSAEEIALVDDETVTPEGNDGTTEGSATDSGSGEKVE